MQGLWVGWGVSCIGGVGHVGGGVGHVEGGGVGEGHAGVVVGHTGVGWVMQGWGWSCRGGGGSCRNGGVVLNNFICPQVRCSVFSSDKLLSTAFWIMLEKACFCL